MNDLEYRTRNLAYASFLLANGAQIPEIRGEQGRAEFVFLDEERALGWQWELFKADAPVPIQQYLMRRKRFAHRWTANLANASDSIPR